MAPIEIYQDYENVKRGKYWLHQFADFRAYSAVIKTLKQCEFKTSKFSYALFRTEIGFAVRRKLRAISEQEQDWEDVAEIWPFELGANPYKGLS